MGKNLNIGGESYENPAHNVGKIDVRSAKHLEDARVKHALMLKLSKHMETCKTCKKDGPTNCLVANSLRNKWNEIGKAE